MPVISALIIYTWSCWKYCLQVILVGLIRLDCVQVSAAVCSVNR